MKAVRPALGIHVPAALFVAAIFSTSVAAAEFSPNSAAWPRGDGWIIQAQAATRAAHDWEIPDSPLLPDGVMPKTLISVPTEFKFDVTLTIRRNEKSLGPPKEEIRSAGLLGPDGVVRCSKSRATRARAVRSRLPSVP